MKQLNEFEDVNEPPITLGDLNTKIDGVIEYVVDLKTHLDERFDGIEKELKSVKDELKELVKYVKNK